jgi:hypothetical protein
MQCEDVDEASFILLSSALTTFRHQVIRAGKVRVDNRPEERLEFDVHTEDSHMGFKPTLHPPDEEMLRQFSVPRHVPGTGA